MLSLYLPKPKQKMETNKRKIINDPVHGFIRIPNDLVFDVIVHPYFQRLRNIGQTGLLNLIFPGAMHTRFHHAVGAMHLMGQALELLKSKGALISAEETEAALLAILLHDVGHGPFSHALENMLMEGWHHEKISLLLMQEINTEFQGRLSMAIEMFQGKYHRPFFNQLISSQLDMDRLDYLKRDSFYTGVSEGNINTERLISMLNVAEDKLVVDDKGLYSVEHFLTSRMFMYWQVYFHKTAAIAERMLVIILRRAKELAMKGKLSAPSLSLDYFLKSDKIVTPNAVDIAQFTAMDDTDIIQAIKTWQSHEDFLLSYYCKSIVYRKFPKTVIASTPFSTTQIEAEKNKAIEYFGHENARELVQSFERKLLPYNAEYQPIEILDKRGNITPLHTFDGHILASSISNKHKRYILSVPRESKK